MKRKLWKPYLGMLVCMTMFLNCADLTQNPAHAAREVSVYLNGAFMSFDVPAQIVNNRTLVPLRAIFEAMGAAVSWDEESKTATGIKGNTVVVLPVGSLSPTINGVVVPLDVPAQIVNNRTLAPLRFVGEAFGGSVTWDDETARADIRTNESAAEIAGIEKNPVDLTLTADELSCVRKDGSTRPIRPGIALSVQTKVRKSTSDAAGGFVEFLLDGETADKVPFVMDASDSYVLVKTTCFLSFEQFPDMTDDDLKQIVLKARVTPDDTCRETNPADNETEISVTASGTDAEPNETPAAADITSLKTTGDLGECAVTPGEWITVKTSLTGEKGKYTRIYTFIDGKLLNNEQCYLPKSDDGAQSSFSYFVPWMARDQLTITVALEDGAQASMTVPVEPYDFQARAQGFSFVCHGTDAGDTVSIKARVFQDSRMSFGHGGDALRYRFIVNGLLSAPIRPDTSSAYAPCMAELDYSYKIPESCSWPLEVKVVADPGGLFQETRESNNVASLRIPMEPAGESGPFVSVSAADVWILPAVAVPGQEVQLFAAVKNESVTSTTGMTLEFTINGEQLDPGNASYSGAIRGGQYHVFQEKWTVPKTITEDPVWTFRILPGAGLSGDSTEDNTTSIVLPLARPDIEVADSSAFGKDGDRLTSGGAAQLSAVIRNNGMAQVGAADISFIINGAVCAVKTVSLPARGSVSIAVPYQVPGVADETPAGGRMSGVSDYVQLRGSGSLTFRVAADLENLIGESDETNNTAGPKTLQVLTGSSRGVVRVQVKEEEGTPLSGAFVQIEAGYASASATTDEAGYCSFIDVPFGPYRVTADKGGFNQAGTNDEYLYSGDLYDFVALYLDDDSFVRGTVTSAAGAKLDGVCVQAEQTGCRTRTDADGAYSLKLPPGTYVLKFIKEGYAPYRRTVSITPAASKTETVSMDPTNFAYVFGWIEGTQGEPLSGMKVEAIRAGGSVLAETVTDADGYYALEVPLYALYAEDIGIKVTGSGLSKTQGLFLRQGLEERCDFSFVPGSSGSGSLLSSVQGKVTPWAECASVPGTFFTNEYEVDAIYGTFGLDTFITAENARIDYLNIDISPESWLYGSVSSSWSPTDLLEINNPVLDAAIEVASFIIPLEIPIAAGFQSIAKTKVWIKKIVIVSDGAEVGEPVYPDAVNDFAYAPNVAVNWDDCLIKYYLKVGPEHEAANPAAGYGYDRVLVVWNPKTKEFVKLGYYVVTGWNEALGHETYMDE